MKDIVSEMEVIETTETIETIDIASIAISIPYHHNAYIPKHRTYIYTHTRINLQ